MTRVLVFGTYDGLHKGHLDFFKQAKKHGTELFVVVARDATVHAVKRRTALHNEQKRLKAVQECSLVTTAVLGNPGDKYCVIEELKPDVICLGYDQVAFTEKLEAELKKRTLHIPIHRLQPYKPEMYKSSTLREKTN